MMRNAALIREGLLMLAAEARRARHALATAIGKWDDADPNMRALAERIATCEAEAKRWTPDR